MKYCPSCKKALPESLFTKLKSSKDGLSFYCGKCCSEKQRNWWRIRGRKSFKPGISRREQLQRVRKDVFKIYGNKCVCCGESKFEFLTIDHINGGGNKDRQKRTGQQLYYQLRKEGVMNPDFRILCWNCNASFAYHKICPHTF